MSKHNKTIGEMAKELAVASPQATSPDAVQMFAERLAEISHPDGNKCAAQPAAGTTPQIAIHVFQQDWTPGFAAFHDDGCISETAKAHVVLNLGAFMSAIQTKDLDPKDLPYFVAESLMHEVVHVLEAWANVEFSEDRVEALLTKYREKYERATIWEYTGGEPHE